MKEQSGGEQSGSCQYFALKLEMEEVFSMAVVCVGSVLYVLSPDAMLPIVVLVSVTLLVCAVLCDWSSSSAPTDGKLTEMYYFRRRLSMLDLTSAAWMWWAFLLYAILFRDVPMLLPKSLDYVQSTGAVLIALLSYWRAFVHRRRGMLGAMLLVQMLLMVAPHRDAVSHSRATFVFVAKVVLFMLFYSATRVVQMFASDNSIGGVFDARFYAFSEQTVSMPLRAEYMYSLLQRIIQTFWILLADKHVFFVGLCVQMVVFFGTVVSALLPILKNNVSTGGGGGEKEHHPMRGGAAELVKVEVDSSPSSSSQPIMSRPLAPPGRAAVPSSSPSAAPPQPQRFRAARPMRAVARFRPAPPPPEVARSSEPPPPTSEEIKKFLLQSYQQRV